MTLAFILSVACGDDSDTARDVQERVFSLRTFDNRGAVCLSPRENAAIAVDVFTDICLSSSCNTPEVAACTAVLDGDRLVISSQLMVNADMTPGRVCTTDCGGGRVGVACGEIQPGAATSLRVVHGSYEYNVLPLPLVSDALVYDNGSVGDCTLQPETYFNRQ